MSNYMKTGVYTRGENEYAFNFNTSLSAHQKSMFVRGVVNAVVSDDYYYAHLTDIVFDFKIIDIFTDIDLSEVSDEENAVDIDIAEVLLNETNIVNIVKENADYGLINELRNSVEKCIEYKTGIHRNLLDEALVSLVNKFENMVSSVDMNEVIKMGQMLNGISGELTASKILDAYAQSDMYKSNNKNNSNLKVVDNKKTAKPRKKSNAAKTATPKQPATSWQLVASTFQSPNYEA